MQPNNDCPPTVLEYLSFEADATATEEPRMMMTPTRPPRNSSSNGSNLRSGNDYGDSNGSALSMQGFLWKRRDIFKNRWRPRWFVLHPDQRVLTYYLLANQEAGVGPQQIVSGGSSGTTTPRRRGSRSNIHGSPLDTPPATDILNSGNNRRRTLSESSAMSTGTIDCDVVPRGTIYLLGSTVEANEALTKPQDGLYTLTITDHETGTHSHLAARDPETREEWILRIRRVCQSGTASNAPQPYSQATPPPVRPGRGIRSNPRSKRKDRRRIRNSVDSTSAATGTRNELHVEEDPVAATNGSKRDLEPLFRDGESSDDAADKNLSTAIRFVRENEVLVLAAPLVLYKALMLLSFDLPAALSFAVTSTLVARWVLIYNLSSVVRFLTGSGNTTGNMPIGHGSVCCRFAVHLDSTKPSAISHVLVQSLAKAIRRQPLLASKKLPLLPRIYSTDLVLLDLATTSSNASQAVRVNNADQKSLSEIGESFADTDQLDTMQTIPMKFLEKIVGPPCRIVVSSETDGGPGPEPQIQLDLNLTECPITVLVSKPRTSTRGKYEVHVSVTIQSTDVGACQQFAVTFERLLAASERSISPNQ
ncbi:unnamed protein product [Pseudo-nitzschia multistriata]|uniref:PH domain-containing protein n=1 Tax=Pseudo-nitzschia multistriata TaxID=183589 RepID=A0A448Z920_9STRA|nr:unnamed protein product [Pseudo-nitzschia multistriata]